jgi:hypothetical protein
MHLFSCQDVVINLRHGLGGDVKDRLDKTTTKRLILSDLNHGISSHLVLLSYTQKEACISGTRKIFE